MGLADVCVALEVVQRLEELDTDLMGEGRRAKHAGKSKIQT